MKLTKVILREVIEEELVKESLRDVLRQAGKKISSGTQYVKDLIPSNVVPIELQSIIKNILQKVLESDGNIWYSNNPERNKIVRDAFEEGVARIEDTISSDPKRFKVFQKSLNTAKFTDAASKRRNLTILMSIFDQTTHKLINDSKTATIAEFLLKTHNLLLEAVDKPGLEGVSDLRSAEDKAKAEEEKRAKAEEEKKAKAEKLRATLNKSDEIISGYKQIIKTKFTEEVYTDIIKAFFYNINPKLKLAATTTTEPIATSPSDVTSTPAAVTTSAADPIYSSPDVPEEDGDTSPSSSESPEADELSYRREAVEPDSIHPEIPVPDLSPVTDLEDFDHKSDIFYTKAMIKIGSWKDTSKMTNREKAFYNRDSIERGKIISSYFSSARDYNIEDMNEWLKNYSYYTEGKTKHYEPMSEEEFQNKFEMYKTFAWYQNAVVKTRQDFIDKSKGD